MSLNQHETERILLLCHPSGQCWHLRNLDRAIYAGRSCWYSFYYYTFQLVQFIRFFVFIADSMLPFKVLGAVTPSVAPVVLAIAAYVAAAVQVFGFMGVAQVCIHPSILPATTERCPGKSHHIS